MNFQGNSYVQKIQHTKLHGFSGVLMMGVVARSVFEVDLAGTCCDRLHHFFPTSFQRLKKKDFDCTCASVQIFNHLQKMKSAILSISRNIFAVNQRLLTKRIQLSPKISRLCLISGATFAVAGALTLQIKSSIVYNDDMQTWDERWRTGNISFHVHQVNESLSKYLGLFLEDGMSSPKNTKRVLVPLCGKTVDMIFLQNLGHKVPSFYIQKLHLRPRVSSG
jgi:hypothetical protein